jgi:hypothetical protein
MINRAGFNLASSKIKNRAGCRSVCGPDWIGFGENQNPNYIRYYGLGLVK